MRRALPFLAVALLLIGGWYIVAPRVASHYGWATSWPNRMPSVVYFNGRQYAGPTGCVRRSRTPIKDAIPSRVGTVPKLFGTGVPIYENGANKPGDPADVAIITEPSSGCYVLYGLQGGP